ncbi:MAG: hypothetical protein R3E97_21355 [Candidatus Eisenbacteria bacterium]
MYKEIVINADPSETRIAVLEDAKLVELFVEREEERRLVGDIYKGKSTPSSRESRPPSWKSGFFPDRVPPLVRLLEPIIDIEGFDIEEVRVQSSRRPKQDLNIQDHLKKGQEEMVQVIKEPIGQKGPKVTRRLSLPGVSRPHARPQARGRLAEDRRP